jgi:hypothetical protein
MADPRSHSLAHTFEPLPLSRGRAYLSLTFGGLALLFVGGVLSYASGSPDVHGSVSTYWTVLFSFYALAFGGAAVLGAFPRLARRPIKLAWLALLLAVFVAALAIRSMALSDAGVAVPPIALGQYAVALLPLAVGLWWRGEPADAGEPGSEP